MWPPAIKSKAGVIVTINREGDAAIIRGLLREADRKALEAIAAHGAEGDFAARGVEATDNESEAAAPSGRPATSARR